MKCPFYGVMLIQLNHQIVSRPTGGSQCGLITSSHAPCSRELASGDPDWSLCLRNPANNGSYEDSQYGIVGAIADFERGRAS